MYIKRELEEKVLKYLDVKEILAIIGPRQAGKTTLIRNCLDKLTNKKINKISFDEFSILEEFENNLEDFIERRIKGFDIVFIDEIQYCKNSGQKLKYIYDTFKDLKLIISGSSATELSINSIKYLVGRIFVFELWTLSFNEFLRFKDEKLYNLFLKNEYGINALNDINKYLIEYISYGGYPRVVLSNNIEEKKEVLKNIYNTYILKEIKEILQYKESHLISNLVKNLSIQVGGIINYNELSAKTGIGFIELKNALNILEKTYICKSIKNFHTNKQIELVKSPKVYFYDLGFRNCVLNNYDVLLMNNLGELYENFIFIQYGNKYELKYWRTKGKAEVDFIFEKQANELIPIEIKSKINSDVVEKSFRSFIDIYTPKEGYILSLDYGNKRDINECKIEFLPFVKFISQEK